MPSLQTLGVESFWVEKSKYSDAEKSYFEQLSKKLLHDNKELLSEENKQSPNLTMQSSENFSNEKAEKLSNEKATEPCVVVPSSNKSRRKKKNQINVDKNQIISADKNEGNFDKNQIEQLTLIKSSESDVVVGQQLQENDEFKENKSKKKRKKNNRNQNYSTEQVDKNSQQQCVNVEKDKKQIKPNAKNNKGSNQCTLVSEIAKARQHIKNSLEKMDEIPGPSSELQERLSLVEKENADLRELVESMKKCWTEKIKSLEQRLDGMQSTSTKDEKKNIVKQPAESQNDEDDGVDLFASDSEDDADADKVREERLAAYAAKKSTKPALIAKSSLLLDVKPWDDETDLKAMETEIRKIKCDGLLWGASKFAPVAFGIQKLCINCVVEDEKVSIDWLTEEIEKSEDFVQSVDVAAFNKI